MAAKTRVGVLFGGRSAEHEVSLVSAASVIHALDKEKYEIIPIGITADGKWLSSENAIELLKSKSPMVPQDEAMILPDPTFRGLFSPNGEVNGRVRSALDVLFPVLHGSFGEDGTMQGLFDLSGIPYVGAGVLGSSVGMDKVVTKQLCEQAKIPVAPFLYFVSDEYLKDGKKIVTRIERTLRYPCFVKPANSGSSVGISKAHDRKELQAAISLAMEYDRKILIERSIERAREIELSVLGNDAPIASIPGEIISSNEFYDYDAKYVDGKSAAVIPAKLSAAVVRKLQDLAIRAFKAIDCAGMGRVDFLLKKDSDKIYFNEINTIPGFTSISMYPKLWEASGLAYKDLLDRLIAFALERHRARARLKTTFQPKVAWYKNP